MFDTDAEADAYVHAVARDWRSAPLTPIDRALSEFAASMTHRQQQMTEADLDGMRSLGLDDRAIHDAAQVVGYFNYITRVADALGVEPEDFIRPWGAVAGGEDVPAGGSPQ